MTTIDARTQTEKIADAAEMNQIQMWRAAQVVRAQVPDQAECDEMLACLGLADLVRPAGV